jgi:ABC-2 type transport system ATP-binding protein
MEIIRKLAASGVTIILCTHILADVERVANKVGILRHGVMAVDGTLLEVQKMFADTVALFVRLRYMPDASDPLCGIDAVERSDIWNGGLTLYARRGVSEEELYSKVIAALSAGNTLPEGIAFRRLTLEQIYIGVNNDTLRPVPAQARGA